MASLVALMSFLLLSTVALAQTAPLAITHVTVIDATGAAPQRDMTVLIGGERIQTLGRTGELAVPPNAQVIDASGKFLMPGLWDTHVHWNDERYLQLFIANGVTGIRVMWGYPRHLEQRRRIAEGTLVGPRLALAGTIIDGPKPFWPESIAAGTAGEGREAVQPHAERGLRLREGVQLASTRSVFRHRRRAKKRNIPVVGHVPDLVRVARRPTRE